MPKNNSKILLLQIDAHSCLMHAAYGDKILDFLQDETKRVTALPFYNLSSYLENALALSQPLIFTENMPLVNAIAALQTKNHYDEIILRCGSLCQDHDTDIENAKHNKLPLFTEELQHFALAFRDYFASQKMNVKVTYDPGLFGDVLLDNPRNGMMHQIIKSYTMEWGNYFSINSKYHQLADHFAKKTQIKPLVLDSSKLLFILCTALFYAQTKPKAHIDLYFIDDRHDILQNLFTFFANDSFKNAKLLPRNINLSLFPYGDVSIYLSARKLIHSPREVISKQYKPIQGKSQVITAKSSGEVLNTFANLMKEVSTLAEGNAIINIIDYWFRFEKVYQNNLLSLYCKNKLSITQISIFKENIPATNQDNLHEKPNQNTYQILTL